VDDHANDSLAARFERPRAERDRLAKAGVAAGAAWRNGSVIHAGTTFAQRLAMRVDVAAKRGFPFVVGLLLLTAAFLQAVGFSRVIAASFGAPSGAIGMAPRGGERRQQPASDDHTKTAAAILARNPFDSVTGPLEESPALADDASRNPMQDPTCQAGRALLVVRSEEDEAWSFAALAGPDGQAVLRRVGDEVGGYTVTSVGRDRVWLTHDAKRCQLELFRAAPASVAASKSASGPPTTERSGMPTSLASRIRRTGETSFEVQRSALDEILARQSELLRAIRITPEKSGGETTGVRLGGIRDGSLLATLGLRNGDRIRDLDGLDLRNPESALHAYARLRTADHLRLGIVREGRPMSFDISIK
jgi:general secretion pathway protein C